MCNYFIIIAIVIIIIITTIIIIKLSDTQLKKLKDAVSNNTGTTLRINLKMLNGNNLPHELLLTTIQKK